MVRRYGTVVKSESGSLYKEGNDMTFPKTYDTFNAERNVEVPFVNVISEMRRTMMKGLKEKENEPTAYKIPREVLKCPLLHGSKKPTSMSLRYFSEKPNVASTVQNIIADVHRTMKSVTPANRAPSIPAAIAEPSANDQETIHKKKHSRRMRGGQNRSRINIPAMKANYSQKMQLNMKRGNHAHGFTDPSSQRRLREVLQQKTMLQTMLNEHRRLQRDRLTIAMDIQKMRNDLDKIRHILDASLQSLKSTRTFASQMTNRPGVPTSPNSNRVRSGAHNPVSRRASSINTTNSGNLKKTITKRQMVTRPKRLKRSAYI